MKSRLIVSVFVLQMMLAPSFCWCQNLKIKYLGIEQGLSNNLVTCVEQDRYGFMWIGTYYGLNRFDGYDFNVYRNALGDSTSLVNNHIKAISAVGDRLYIGTEKGLVYFDYTDLKFHSLFYHDAAGKIVKVDFNINNILGDREANVYVATATGILKYNKNSTVAEWLPFGKGGAKYGVQTMATDAKGALWAFINNVGLARYDEGQKRFLVQASVSTSANCMIFGHKDEIWIGSNNGLYVYTQHNRQYARFDNETHRLKNDNVSNLTMTRNGEVWISTNGGGINIWNADRRELRTIVSDDNNGSLRSSVITGIYEDAEGRKWVGTLRGGVNIIDNKSIPFRTFAHDPFNPNSVINNFILSFCEDDGKNIWIGTDGGGLSYWNTAHNSFASYKHQNAPGSLSSNFVVSIVKDFTGQVWVASFNGGVDAFDKATNTFKHYSCYNPVVKREERTPWKLYEDRQRRLWVGNTWGGALYLFNRPLRRFEVFDPGLVDIHALYEDDRGELWGGDYTRLIHIDPVHKKHEYTFIGQAIRSINENKHHQLLIGTDGGGLLIFDPRTKKLTRYTEANGLSSNAVLNILVDNKDNIWFSTYNGLNKRDAKTGEFIRYFASDGLQSNQFSYNAALKLSDGEMLFGGIKGFNKFDPDSVTVFNHQPEVQLTGFRVNNEPVESTAYAGHQPLNEVEEITIPFEAATIAVSYTALEYSFPEKISYAYYLENWDHNWNYVGKLKSAYFSRLNEGTYILKIKSTNTDGHWSKTPLVVKIIVLPPWYRTWWAYLFYLAVIGAVVYWYWQYRIRQTRLQYEVQIANLKVEQEKEANERKLSFFTNVSHEFRTPLTLIINPIKDLLRNNRGPAEELSSIHRNAKRLLGLVDQLLLFRKAESETPVLNLGRVNFSFLCKEIFSSFTQQARIKHINYIITASEKDIEILGDREKIEIALFNLVSNAFKFTPEQGSIHITVKDDDKNAYFEISDSGVGINADVGERLFDKYYQIKDSNSLKTGFGIGLFLVKSFMDAHKGTISYKSTSGMGTTFILCLPRSEQELNSYPAIAAPVENELIEELIEYENPEPAAEQTEPQLELLISDRPSVLVIDDNPEIRAYIRRIFAEIFTIYEAGNGQQGLEMIKKYLPDVVISDIVMPGLSGLELCTVIKNDSQLSHIPIILLTGETAPDIRLQGIEGGAVDFITKPFDKDLLIARVKGIIKNKQELQKYFFSEVTLKTNHRNVSEEDKDFLYRCFDVVEESMLGEELEVHAFADKLGLSYSTLFKRIKSVTGMSINGFIRYVRLQKAAEILINTNCNVNEAAFRVGFSDVKYFREHFNKQFGLNPSEFI